MTDEHGKSRRRFIKTMAAGGAALGISLPSIARPSAPATANAGPSAPAAESVVVGIIGTGGRGGTLARKFAQLASAEVAYVCDVDERRRNETAAAVGEAQDATPKAVNDLRRILEDSGVDAVVIATPEHWQTPAALLAIDAGKHVYIEKPGSHNPREGELLVEAAARHRRVVQMGNQRRSWPKIIEAMDRIKGGLIGPVHYSRGWYANTRNSIGHGAPAAVPSWLDFDLWQGPAPRRPYRDNILHYNWHWFWHWGTGEAGNNGIHALDLCRWGLGVDHPVRVTSAGGRYFFDDDQETPDTQMITFQFEGDKSVIWEGQSCNGRGIDGQGFGASFHGEDGSVSVEGLGYRVYDRSGELVEYFSGRAGEDDDLDIDVDHLTNFVEAIRDEASLRSPIAEGQKSTLLCHLGNIAQRVGRDLTCRAKDGRIVDDAEAMKLWEREYAPGWEPRI